MENVTTENMLHTFFHEEKTEEEELTKNKETNFLVVQENSNEGDHQNLIENEKIEKSSTNENASNQTMKPEPPLVFQSVIPRKSKKGPKIPKTIDFETSPKNKINKSEPQTLDSSEIVQYTTGFFQQNLNDKQKIQQPSPIPKGKKRRPKIKNRYKTKTQDSEKTSFPEIKKQEKLNKTLDQIDTNNQIPAAPPLKEIVIVEEEETLPKPDLDQMKTIPENQKPVSPKSPHRLFFETIDESDLKQTNAVLPEEKIIKNSPIKKRKKGVYRKKMKQNKEKEELLTKIELLEKKLKEQSIDDRIADLERVTEEQSMELELAETENRSLIKTIEKLRKQQEDLVMSDIYFAQEQRKSESLRVQLNEANDTISELKNLLQVKEEEIEANQIIVSQLKEQIEQSQIQPDEAIEKMIKIFDAFVAERKKLVEELLKEKDKRRKANSKIEELTNLLNCSEKSEADRIKAESRLSLCHDRINSLEQHCIRLTKENNALKKLVLEGGKLAARKENEAILKEVQSLRKENRKLKRLNEKKTPLYQPMKVCDSSQKKKILVIDDIFSLEKDI